MKTRIIQTRFWDDEFVSNSDLYTQHLYIYLLTSQYVNISGIFQLPSKKIMLEASLTDNQFNSAKDNLEKANKVKFCDGWVYVVNACKNNKYTNSPDNQKAYDREISQVPDKVRAYFDSTVDSSVDSTVGVLPTVTITNKQEIIKEKDVKEKQTFSSLSSITPEVINEIAEYYHCSTSFVNIQFEKMKNWLEGSGKVKKNYKATLRNFVLSELEKTNKGARIEIGIKPEAKLTPVKPETPEDKAKSRLVADKVRQDLEKRGILRTVKSF